MKVSKRFLCLFLTLVMVLSAIPFTALAAEPEAAEVMPLAADAYLGVDAGAKVPASFQNDLWTQYDFKELNVGDTATITPRRVEEAITDAVGNNVELPHFNYEIISGDSIVLEGGENAHQGVKAVKAGNTVVKITYDALSHSGGKEFGACDPVNTQYVIYSVGGNSAITIEDNIDARSVSTAAAGKILYRSYDTKYFTEGKTTTFPLTVKTTGAESLVVKCNGKTVKAVEGVYNLPLENRNNIIEMTATAADGTTRSFFRVLAARKIAINVKNVTNPGQPLKAGEKANISFTGIKMPVYKLASIYNPQMGTWGGKATNVHYMMNGTKYVGACGQWDLATNNDFDVTFAEKGMYTFTDGGINCNWWGSALGTDKGTDAPGSPNLNAPTSSGEFSMLPDFVVPVDQYVHVIVENTTFLKPWTDEEGFTYEPTFTGTLLQTDIALTGTTTMMDCVEQAVQGAGKTITITGRDNGGYITEIDGMMEFDGGQGSGWMGTLNNWFTNYGFGNFKVNTGKEEQKLRDGDVVRVMYTCNLGEDLGGDFGSAKGLLSSLEAAGKTLTPAFAADTCNYDLMLEAPETICVKALAQSKQDRVIIRLNGQNYYHSDLGEELAVKPGDVITVYCGHLDASTGEEVFSNYTIKVKKPVTAVVSYTAQAEGQFMGIARDVTVSSDLAESFGFTDTIPVEENVSALDVMVQAHVDMFAATREDISTCLQVSSSGMVGMLFGIETSANGFVVNGMYPHDGTKGDYGYNGTLVNSTRIAAGDHVDFFVYQDQNYWMDQLSWIETADGYVTELTAEAEQQVELTVKGYMYMGGSSFKDIAALHAAGEGLDGVGLQLMDGIISTPVEGTTDLSGNITMTMPAEPGTYYLSVSSAYDAAADEGYAVVMPLVKLTVTEKAPAPAVKIDHYGQSLSLEDNIYINNYVKISGAENIDLTKDAGLLIWKTPVTPEAAVIGSADAVNRTGLIATTSEDGVIYGQQTEGIAAPQYADTLYLRVYVKDADGVITYGPLEQYDVRTYCEKALAPASTTPQTLKDTCAQLLHFGAAAQVNFNYNMEDPANKNILADHPSAQWDETLLNEVIPADTALQGTGDVLVEGKSLSLDDRIMLNFYFAPNGYTVDTAELMFWVDVTGALTEANGQTMALTKLGEQYAAQPCGFAAAEYGKTIYVRAKLTDSEGGVHYSDVVAYSPEAYAASAIQNSKNPNLVETVKMMVLYGEAARIHFGR